MVRDAWFRLADRDHRVSFQTACSRKATQNVGNIGRSLRECCRIKSVLRRQCSGRSLLVIRLSQDL